MFGMKATIDIPNELYRRVNAKSALEGRPVDAVVADLLQRSLDETPIEVQRVDSTQESPVPTRLTRRELAKQHPTPKWLEDWFRRADEAFKDAPPGPTAREILEQDRNRLEG
jgi:hypothetical protein